MFSLRRNHNYINIEQLIEAMDHQMKTGEWIIDHEQLLNKFTEYNDYVKKNEQQAALSLNQIMRNITELDELRDMLVSIFKQVESVQLIVSSSEELATATERIAEMTVHTQVESQQAKNQGTKGIHSMTEAIEFVQAAFDDIALINEQVNQVEEKVKEVNKTVDIVKDIAWQINLLSLNASIEAARAGEHGKGFAVVASEVKGLSQYTEKSVNEIGERMNELNGITLDSVRRIHQVSEQISVGQGLIQRSLGEIQGIEQSIGQVDANVMELASIAEEQSSATSLLATEIMEVSNQAQSIESRCQKTAGDIYQLSSQVEEIRKQQLANGGTIAFDDQIELYKVDHLLWRWKVYNVLLGFAQGDSESAGNYKDCRLGKWYYSITDSVLNENKDFIALEEPHIQLHVEAKKAMVAFKSGDIHGAEGSLQAMDQYSTQVLTILDRLKGIYGKVNE